MSQKIRQEIYEMPTSDIADLYNKFKKRGYGGYSRQALLEELNRRHYFRHQKRESACALTAQPLAFDFSTQTDAQLQSRLERLLRAAKTTDAISAQCHAIDRELRLRASSSSCA